MRNPSGSGAFRNGASAISQRNTEEACQEMFRGIGPDTPRFLGAGVTGSTTSPVRPQGGAGGLLTTTSWA
eukprot:15020651-Alexandrium_andersonii.AAC.1